MPPATAARRVRMMVVMRRALVPDEESEAISLMGRWIGWLVGWLVGVGG